MKILLEGPYALDKNFTTYRLTVPFSIMITLMNK